jgi:hypothetical protein
VEGALQIANLELQIANWIRRNLKFAIINLQFAMNPPNPVA